LRMLNAGEGAAPGGSDRSQAAFPSCARPAEVPAAALSASG
jgi:hypothetical protein